MTRFWVSVTVLAVIHAVFANGFEPVGRGKHQLWSGALHGVRVHEENLRIINGSASNRPLQPTSDAETSD